MHIDVNTQAQPDKARPRYLLLDQLYTPKATASTK